MQRIKSNRSSPLLFISLLLLSSFFALVPLSPIVHAANPTLNATVTCTNTSSASCTSGSLTIAAASNEMIIVEIGIYRLVSAVATISTVTDSQGDTFTKAVGVSNSISGGTNRATDSEIWYASVSSTTSRTITVTASASVDIISFAASDVSGIGGLSDTQSSECHAGSSGCGAGLTTSSPTSYTAANILFNQGVHSGTFLATCESVAGPFTLLYRDSSLQVTCNGYYIPGGSGSSSYPMQANVASSIDTLVGASFGAGAAVTVVVIGPCTFFQLQCWWYPLLFMFLYSGVLMLAATMLKTSSKGKSHIFLSAITFGSLIAVILGIMNIVFPLIMLVINTIIVLRLRG